MTAKKEKPNKNLELWDMVTKTDPSHTKEVKLGRKITAIDPYQQIKSATKIFGPAGKGWGFRVVDTVFLPTNTVACLIELWHGKPDNAIQQWGQWKLYLDKKDTMPNNDCMKAATTDGITKCLSMLGFNTDIFLGKYEDNKYVQEMNEEFKKPEKKVPLKGPLQRTALTAQLTQYMTAMRRSTNIEEFKQAGINFKEALDQSKEEFTVFWTETEVGGETIEARQNQVKNKFAELEREEEMFKQQKKDMEPKDGEIVDEDPFGFENPMP